ncbi:hypothetical protein IKD60_00670, partial [Candidatus Saccharibacteria bacterium]|nr:hypothetical protein [Candidatus Saccharibacteria bacterium]
RTRETGDTNKMMFPSFAGAKIRYDSLHDSWIFGKRYLSLWLDGASPVRFHVFYYPGELFGFGHISSCREKP